MVAMPSPTDDKPATKPGDIVKEAVDYYKACKEWQGVEDERAREDIKFANADERNAWQWPRAIYDERNGEDLPALTINTTRVHNDLIINQLSKNGYGIKIRPTGGKASYKSAEVMQALVRRIEYISKASTHYRKVAEQQVDGGIGYILLETAYTSNRSRDQDIYLKAARDPTAVYLDPWIQEPDGSDATFGFVCERMPRKTFNRKYPRYKNKVGTAPLDTAFAEWLNDKEIMLVKYFRKNPKDDTYVWWKAEDGSEQQQLASDIKDDAGKDIFKALVEDIKEGRIEGGTRAVTDDKVEWYLIAGDTIVEKGDWAGKYIPICRCVGRELVIDGTLDRKGHTRPLIGAQRMLNYNASMAIEIVALQPKAPIMAPARAIEGQEQFKELNIKGFPVLLYNDIDDEAAPEAQKIAPPFRLEPPKPSIAHEQGMQTAERHGMMISGQFQAQMGENDTQSAASGKAINERKEQGDVATYHFTEHRGDMLRNIGTQLLDLIPKIYDTTRMLHIMDDDGEKSWIRIDPDQTDVVQEFKGLKQNEDAVKLAFNPTIGEYECVSDPGPDFATQRQEAWNAMTMLMQSNNELISVAADLLFKNGDFPGADKIAERLQKEIKAAKPYLFDENADPQVQSLQQQLQKAAALNGELMQKLAEKGLQLRGKQELRDVEAFNAETTRQKSKDESELGMLKVQLDAVTKLLLAPPDQRIQFEHELRMRNMDMQHEHATMDKDHVFTMIQQANEAALNPKANGSDGTQ